MLCTTSSVWVAFCVCALLTHHVPILQKIAQHGKCTTDPPSKISFSNEAVKSIGVVARLLVLIDKCHDYLFVPKKLFVHLYVVGCGCAVYHLLLAWEEETSDLNLSVSTERGVRDWPHILVHSPQLLLLVLWSCHVFRRLLESLYITHYGSSRMHLGGYVAGLIHYMVVPISLRETSAYTANSRGSWASWNVAVILFPCLLFLLANFYQYEAHSILFRMKVEQLKSKEPSNYQLPVESWFSITCVPHYTAEVVIYLCFALLSPLRCWSPKLLLLWVMMNLAVVARNQHSWYLQQYPSQVPRPWYKLFPFIW